MKKYCLNFIICFWAALLVGCGGAGGSGASGSINDTNAVTFSELSVNMLTPTPGSKRVVVVPEIQLKFSEPVLNVVYPNVSLHESSPTGPEVELTNIIAGDDNTYTFSPAVSLKTLTTYYVVLTNAITTAQGVALENTVFSFKTEGRVQPYTTILSPANNSIGVTRTPDIVVRFNEAVENVNDKTIALVEGSIDGPTVAIGQLIAKPDNIYSITPLLPLNSETKYYVILSRNIADDSGNHLRTTIFNFTTGENLALPDSKMY